MTDPTPITEDSINLAVRKKREDKNWQPTQEFFTQAYHYIEFLKTLPKSHWSLFKKPAKYDEMNHNQKLGFVKEKYFDKTPEEIIFETECKIKYLRGD